MKFLVAILSVVAFVFLTLAPAHSAVCRPYDDFAQFLGEKYSEAPVMRALEARNSAVVLFASQDGSSWTLVILAPTGEACIAGTGTDVEIFDWVDPKPEVLPQSF